MQQELRFSYKVAAENRDAGIKKAVNHCNDVVPDWTDKAFAFLQKYVREHKGQFMTEDVRQAAEKAGLPTPSPRAWGGIIRKASRVGIVTKLMVGPVKNVKAHCANAGVWIKNEAA